MRSSVRPVVAMSLALSGLSVAVPAKAEPTHSALENLLDRYQTASPQQVIQLVSRLNQDEQLILGVYNQLMSDIYIKVCQANPNARFVLLTSPMNCMMLAQSLQQAMRWGLTEQSFRAEAEGQRQQVLASYKCTRGEIDRSVCKQYYSTLKRTNEMQHDTSLRIIENMDGRCRIGIDPGCR